MSTPGGGGGTGKPKYGQLTVCWASDEEQAKETALKYWGYTGLPGQLSQELALPQYFVITNLASLIAFVKFLAGERYTRWEPSRE